eukprot:6198818-Pleurochrysis_carterae.AAC.1
MTNVSTTRSLLIPMQQLTYAPPSSQEMAKQICWRHYRPCSFNCSRCRLLIMNYRCQSRPIIFAMCRTTTDRNEFYAASERNDRGAELRNQAAFTRSLDKQIHLKCHAMCVSLLLVHGRIQASASANTWPLDRACKRLAEAPLARRNLLSLSLPAL